MTIAPPLLQAPMSAITDLPMRTLAEEHGCTLTISEWLPADGLAANVPSTVAKLAPSADGRPFGVQLFGRKPRAIELAAKRVAEVGASFVDLNMGCPGKKVRSGSTGAALMREPELAEELVLAARQGVALSRSRPRGECPVTVKMRAGWDEQSINAPSFAAKMVAAGAAMVTVHGRTRQQRYTGKVDLAIIAEVKRTITTVPVIANGDIVDCASLARTLETTRADGVMIGRGGLGNPWLFAELRAYFTGAPMPAPPADVERLQTYLRHLELYLKWSPIKSFDKPPERIERDAVVEMRKFARWYLEPLGELGKQLRKQINFVESPKAARALLQRAIEQLRA
jgi:tRNA-dihydrouridine synthase B